MPGELRTEVPPRCRFLVGLLDPGPQLDFDKAQAPWNTALRWGDGAVVDDTGAPLRDAIGFSGYTAGKTHNFYHYPARFSPEFARAVIARFSRAGDVVLDPFMGGGTAIVEGLALGRRMVGVDINALAHFLAEVRTTPLSAGDSKQLNSWARCSSILADLPGLNFLERGGVPNLPSGVETFMADALDLTERLPLPRQRAFARCALLRLGQWALDCRDFAAPRRYRLAAQLPVLVESMLTGLAEFVEGCCAAGVPKNQITGRRVLLNKTAGKIGVERTLRPFRGRVRLVITSPPYPGVHVLYHRWQYRGRKETAAPYVIANVNDGSGGSFYTFGSRTPTGMQNYFATLEASFASIRPLLAPDALVVQLVAFADPRRHLPLYLAALEAAGFKELRAEAGSAARMRRRVPNRKWYAKLKEQLGAASEVLLFHRPRI